MLPLLNVSPPPHRPVCTLGILAGLVLLSLYFDCTCGCKVAAASIKVGQMFQPECIAFVRRQPIFAALHEVEQAYF